MWPSRRHAVGTVLIGRLISSVTYRTSLPFLTLLVSWAKKDGGSKDIGKNTVLGGGQRDGEQKGRGGIGGLRI